VAAPPDASPKLPPFLQELYEKPLVQKFWKYCVVSAVGVVLGQSLILLFATGLGWSWGWANVTAVTISTLPTYYLSRAWVWQKHGKSSLYAEIIPFWVMSFLGLLLSTLVVVWLENQYPDQPILANVGNVIGFGVLWLAKFFILDRLLFKVTGEHVDEATPFL
jgi:putative flippase GtrA